MHSRYFQKEDAKLPMSLAVICSDAPHQLHLVEQLAKHFPIKSVLVESDQDQMDFLWRRKRYSLWMYRKYHSKRRQLNGHSAHRRQFFETSWQLSDGDFPVHYVSNVNHEDTVAHLKAIQPDITVVCGTMFIGKKVRTAGNTVINLHGGVLPEYKGNQCVFFALYDQAYDKVGATLHLINGELDGGPLISVVKPEIVPEDNDETLYAKSLQLCVAALVETLKRYDAGEQVPLYKQAPSTKPVYSHRDRTPWVELKYALRRKRRMPAIAAESA
ncbi:MAG: formyl transferase [Bacteroidota bacterium]